MKIAFIGDIALVGVYGESNNSISKVSYLASILQGYDYVIANLESPLTDRKKTMVPKSMHLRASTNNISILKELNINAVSLANNHTYDYGRNGLEDTINTLDSASIKWYGVDGKYLSECICGERINVSGFCCLSTNGVGYDLNKKKGINTLTKDKLNRQISRDIEEGALSVISVHYGIEHTNYPAIEHIRLFSEACDRHPIIIHGHHPHQIQGLQQLGDSLVAYSLGNAIFDDTTSINKSLTVHLNEENRKSFVLGVVVEGGKIIDYSIQGYYIGIDAITPFEIEKELKDISIPLESIDDESVYSQRRFEQYNSVLDTKFGKHDLKWLKARINYYSLGAKLSSMIRSQKYNSIRKQF